MSIRRLMFMATSVRSAPSTLNSRSMTLRRRALSSSDRFFTRVSAFTPVIETILRADVGPIPKMYVSATTTRLSAGRSTPAIRATNVLLLLLPLLVARIPAADDANHALAADHLAVLTDLLDRRTNLHLLLPGAHAVTTANVLLVAIDDAAACQVVGRELHGDLVAGEDLDEVHPHLPGDVGQHHVLVLERHPEHRVGQRLDHRAFDLYAFF